MRPHLLRVLLPTAVLGAATALAPAGAVQAVSADQNTLTTTDRTGDVSTPIADITKVRLVRGTSSINTVMTWDAPPVGNSDRIISQVYFSGQGPIRWQVAAEFAPRQGWTARVFSQRDGRTVEQCRVTALTTGGRSAVKAKIPLRCVNNVRPTRLSGQSLVFARYGNYQDKVS